MNDMLPSEECMLEYVPADIDRPVADKAATSVID